MKNPIFKHKKGFQFRVNFRKSRQGMIISLKIEEHRLCCILPWCTNVSHSRIHGCMVWLVVMVVWLYVDSYSFNNFQHNVKEK